MYFIVYMHYFLYLCTLITCVMNANFGFVRVAAAVPTLRVADCDYNAEQIKQQIDEAVNEGVEVVCFPELSLTGYTCADLFFTQQLQQNSIRQLEAICNYTRGKAIIVLNPAEPPLMMTNTIHVRVKDKSVPFDKIEESIYQMVDDLKKYVPGYQLRVPPTMDGDRVTTIVQVEGQADFLPAYSGNLDIINSAAVAAAEQIAEKMLQEGGNR